jgi:uncharacterized membrane protein YfcA
MTIALGMPGPPVMLYLTGIGVAKNVLRATAFAFFAASYSFSLALQSATVGVGRSVWTAAAVLLPIACVGGFIGHWLSDKVGETAFRRAVLSMLVVIGVSTLIGVLAK